MSERDDVPMLFSFQHDQNCNRDVEMAFRGETASRSIDIPQPPPSDGRVSRSHPSVGGWLRRRKTGVVAPEGPDADRGKEGDALRKGPRGLCMKPDCKTCAPLLQRAREEELSAGSASDAKFRMIWSEDTKGWARRFSSLLDKYFPIRNPQDRGVQLWNRVFIVTCLLSVFVDPLFLFVLGVNMRYKCIFFDWSYAVGVAVLRSVTDLFYLLHMLLQFRLAYVDPKSRTVGSGKFVNEPDKIAKHYLLRFFALDMFNVLPLPQVVILRILPNYLNISGANGAKNVLRVIILIQYIPRIFRFLPLLTGQSATSFIYESPWVNFAINLLMYVLAGHIVGSGWYLLGLQRVNQCFRNICSLNGSKSCSELIDCGNGKNLERRNGAWISNYSDIVNGTWWSDPVNGQANACTNGSDKFDYGIYKSAVILTSERSFTRYTYSLFWGFQQISTLAGNLVPSYFIWEVLFTMFIIMVGLLLLALLIGSMQNFLLSLGRRRLEMQLRRHDMERWMNYRYLPEHLRNDIREADKLSWNITHGVDEDELIRNLPEDIQRKIRRHLFEFLKRVRLFSMMDDQLLDSVCEKLRQNFYTNGSKILSQGSHVDKMIFIIRGTIKIIESDKNTIELSEAGVCGEELLAWYLDKSSENSHDGGRIRFSSEYLPSNRDVTCTSNVEAFTLHAADLEDIRSLFVPFLRIPHVQGAIMYESNYWRSFMAKKIQMAWRRRKRCLSRLNDARITGDTSSSQ